MTTQADLWGGADLKLEHARYFFWRMQKSLERPQRTLSNVALQARHTVMTTDWQRSFYANFDAFLGMCRSVPEIIHACFGADQGSKEMRVWLQQLPVAERQRRQTFSVQFEPMYRAFRQLPLSQKRNITFHRRGVAGVEVTITGRFGVYSGSVLELVPDAESMSIPADADPSIPWAVFAHPVALEPNWRDFQINGRPLYDECEAYRHAADTLVNDARIIVSSVHANDPLTLPPD